VVASDGHTYSRAAIAKWFERNQTSPLTGARLPNLQLLPNHAMRKAMEEAREKQPLAIEPGRLQIHKDQVLGEGSHGCVVAGALSPGPRRTVRVAVKMLHGMTQLEEQAFQRELRAQAFQEQASGGAGLSARVAGRRSRPFSASCGRTCSQPGTAMACATSTVRMSYRAHAWLSC
jgi:hypothetical protein